MHIVIQLTKPFFYLVILSMLHAASMAVFLVYFQQTTAIVLILLLVISYLYSLYRYYFHCIRRLEIRPDNRVCLTFDNTICQQVSLVKVLISNRLFLILLWHHGKKRYQHIIWCDMCSKQEYHHLLLWANWCQEGVNCE